MNTRAFYFEDGERTESALDTLQDMVEQGEISPQEATDERRARFDAWACSFELEHNGAPVKFSVAGESYFNRRDLAGAIDSQTALTALWNGARTKLQTQYETAKLARDEHKARLAEQLRAGAIRTPSGKVTADSVKDFVTFNETTRGLERRLLQTKELLGHVDAVLAALADRSRMIRAETYRQSEELRSA